LPSIAEYTFISQTSKSRIDRIYAAKSIKVISTQVIPNQYSDHDTVVTQFDVPLQTKRGKGFWKNNSSVYENKLFLEDFEENVGIGKRTLPIKYSRLLVKSQAVGH